ncbi:hypothetical protein VBD025_08125 [Virgibacillus flavescens]|uniref:hypothetical protein n=1 Tax=Virgibacillus flavescens TaxID=1611422 RepID=UPI003D34682D
MKKGFLTVLMTIILISFGCSNQDVVNSTKFNPKKENVEQLKDIDTNDVSMELVDFGKEFFPPHFQINSFNIDIPNVNSIEFNINYVLDEELYNFLSDNKPKYYFNIQYPLSLSNIIGISESKFINVSELNVIGSEREFNLIIKQDTAEKLSREDIQDIQSQLEGYRLVIYNVNKQPMHIVDDIFHYSSYDPDLSKQ